MRIARWFIVLGTAVATAGLAVATLQDTRVTERSSAPEQNQTQAVDVQVRGEVHEAFAQPSVLIQKESQIVPQQPPEPVNELPPEQKPEGDNVFWIPGYWSWDEEANNFVWVSGVWRSFPPDHEWVPGYWTEASGGWRWVSGYWTETKVNDVELLPQPPGLIEENVPPARDESSMWVPGIWVWKESKYWWRPGHWVALRPGWMWSPAMYCWTPGGYIFVDGYWDYVIERRGLIFAPVIFDRAVFARRDFVYRPSFVVSFNFLEASLFVNTRYNRYYFGDFYDVAFEQRGFVPWINWHVHGRVGDPLFTAWRFNHRGDADHLRRIETAFSTARTNRDARPVRTLADLRRGNVNPVFQNSVVAINQVANVNQKIRLTPVDRSSMSGEVTQRFRTMATERQRNEVHGTAGRTGRDITGRDATGGDARPPARADTTGRDRTIRPGRDTTGRDATPPVRDTTPTGRDRTVPPGRDKLPPTRSDAGSTRPPVRDSTLPGRGDTTRSTPPGREEANRGPGSNAGSSNNRYQRQRSEHNYQKPSGDRAPPPRPEVPQPQQRGGQGERDRTPPGRDTTPGKDRGRDKDR